MEITVASMSGEEVAAFRAEEHWTLSDVLAKLPKAPAESAVLYRTRLWLGNKELTEGKMLSDIGAANGARLSLVTQRISPTFMISTREVDGMLLDFECPGEILFDESPEEAERMCLVPDVRIDDSRAQEGILIVSAEAWKDPESKRYQRTTRTLRCRDAPAAARRLGDIAARTMQGMVAASGMAMAPALVTAEQRNFRHKRPSYDDVDGEFLLGGWAARSKHHDGPHLVYKLSWLELSNTTQKPDRWKDFGSAALAIWTTSDEQSGHFVARHELFADEFCRKGHVLVLRNMETNGAPDPSRRLQFTLDLTFSFLTEEEACLWHDSIVASIEKRELPDRAARIAEAADAARAAMAAAADLRPPLSPFLERREEERATQRLPESHHKEVAPDLDTRTLLPVHYSRDW